MSDAMGERGPGARRSAPAPVATFLDHLRYELLLGADGRLGQQLELRGALVDRGAPRGAWGWGSPTERWTLGASVLGVRVMTGPSVGQAFTAGDLWLTWALRDVLLVTAGGRWTTTRPPPPPGPGPGPGPSAGRLSEGLPPRAARQ